ncbi:MAG TPA: hypothetical protein VK879_20145, partial [Candidatus Sulfomarinibacteraceae bacterium]|nr:hypothetical protein [Candidatus Sulfomarinibacteraceae bacterium]
MTTKFDAPDTQTQSTLTAFACSLGYTEKVEIRNHTRAGFIALLVAITILLVAGRIDGEMALFWVFGLAFGFV